ncbi:integrase family protein [Roseobacter sp. OBYS 0001]|uniref:integrase family protein n=1 Tax=Roseobacter sp. OBYS 0001 TaxID=882651 RepID=UPI001BC59557|nr:integrase family protein [Roseobacter sp. OBYS 0001]GIT86176.1 hypothetical protein ROBYS_11920 [Roseobacter sp. OBYS 0001]
MPQITFNDRAVAKITTDKTTWFTDSTVRGLRLCVTKTGTKTWWVNKWDPTKQKTRAIKLGQWANTGTHCAWAKKQVGATTLQIVEGHAITRNERAAEKQKLGIPTFGEAFDQYIEHRMGARASGKKPMVEKTAKDYRHTFNRELGAWAHVHVDELPILEINQHLNALQLRVPHSARMASTVAGAVVRFVNKFCALALPIPSTLDNTVTRSRVETGKLDMTVPLSARWAEIEQVKNDHIRLWWMVTTLAGFRQETSRALSWDDIDLELGVVTFSRSKHTYDREIVLSDRVVALFKELHEIKMDDCNWVFPSRRIIGDVRGHIGQVDAIGEDVVTRAGDVRHYWMSAGREHAPTHVLRWLAQQTLTAGDLNMLGHYGKPSHEAQRAAADAIANALWRQIEAAPLSVVALKRECA